MRRASSPFTAVILLSTIILAAGSSPSPSQAFLRELLPLASWERQFKITEGKDRGRLVTLTSSPDLANEKRWRLVFGDYAAVQLAREPSGALIMERLDLLKSRSYILYEPALPVIPADFQQNRPLRRETRYRMYSLASGKLRRSGRVIHQLTAASPSRFDTPAGSLDGYYVELDHRMAMEYYSELRFVVGLGFQPDKGPVYGSGRYILTKLGLFSESKSAEVALFTP